MNQWNSSNLFLIEISGLGGGVVLVFLLWGWSFISKEKGTIHL